MAKKALSLIERAAQALASSLKQQADKLGFFVSDTGRYPALDGCFDMQEAVRAALQAIREPTYAMIEAGFSGFAWNHGSRDDMEAAYRAMIDAVLVEGG